jgi:hypothetical protein
MRSARHKTLHLAAPLLAALCLSAAAHAQCHPRVLARFTALDAETPNNAYGSAIVISRDAATALVGAPGVSETYVLEASTNGWSQGPRLSQSLILSATGSGFGTSVALSSDGHAAIVGAPNYFSAGARTGTAFVLIRSGGVWSQQGPALIASGVTDAASFGYACALSADGNTALIGAPFDQNGGRPGSAYVFVRSAGVWSQQGLALPATTSTASARVGRAVGLSADGNTAAVGAPQDGVPLVGAVFVFTRSGSVWTQQGPALLPTGGGGLPELCGSFLSVNDAGNTIIAGAPGLSPLPGAAYAFVRSGSTWSQQARLTVSLGSYLGAPASVSADGNTALLGSSGTESAFVFTRTGSSWTQRGPAIIAPEGSPRYFGSGLALAADGRTAIIGAGKSRANVSLAIFPIGMAEVFDLCSPTACPADFNATGLLTIQDIFDFLNAWLAADPRADFNGVDGLNTQDVIDFLSAWLTGC